MERYEVKRGLSLLVIFLAIYSCSIKGQKKGHLIDEFYINQSYSEIQEKYTSKEHILDSGELDIKLKTRYEHLNEKGLIELYFYKKKLYQISFYPYDTLSYLNKLNQFLRVKDVTLKDIVKRNIGIYASYNYVSKTREMLHLNKNLCITWYAVKSKKAIAKKNFFRYNHE